MGVGHDDTQPATSDPSATPARAVDLPATISRFTVKSKLGEGGNGVVVLAHDPGLRRDIAIKILRRGEDDDARQRLLREAQSTATLVHDNVIVVHEVGTFEDQVFVAMEHVKGGTLARWQAGRGWRECLAVYVRAGRGLAAAHAAGLVHRDFKPDNVLVGDDGRVRVTDFGLVSVVGTRTAPTPASDDDLAASSLTRTGAIMGTPRYMAPEQHLGEPVDPRTDQFAYCVALYDVMFGRPPFAGATYREVVDRVIAGVVTAPPADTAVPAAVRDAIMRGLARRRDDRFPSMTELLAALDPSIEARRRGRWIPLAVAGAVAAISAVVVIVVLATRDDATGPRTADEAFHQGQRAYDRGDFAAAVRAFKRGFELEPNLSKKGVTYLYNLGQAYRQLHDCPQAVFAYRRFLALETDLAPDRRAELEARTVELEQYCPVARDAR